MEKWKKIQGYEGAYEVSNLGRVRSVNRIVVEKSGKSKLLKGVILKNLTSSNGYNHVAICLNGVTKIERIHRLVAIHFIENPLQLSDVNHKDENKLNNCASNLEWMSHGQNIRHGTNLARRTATVKAKRCFAGENNPMFGRKGAKNPRSTPVKQFDKCGSLIHIYQSIKEASQKTGVNYTSITSVCKGRTKTAGNYIWKLLKNENSL